MKKTRENSELFKQLPDKIIEKAKKALENGAEKIVADAKNRCPVRTGNLKDSIHAEKKKDGMSYRIVADAKSNSKNNAFYGKVVEFSPKINKPYLYPAMDANRKTVLEDIGKAINEACKRGD